MTASRYRVGVGKDADPYVATLRALDACSEWPPPELFGRQVIIKPNLVVQASPETGAVTDPQVVRAIVDTALAAGAAEVLIAEGAKGGEYFSACGYDFFQSYDPAGRVALVNLDEQPATLVAVPDGLAYRQIYLPELVLDAEAYLISVAKLKCHVETLVTLSMKNLFGLPPLQRYQHAEATVQSRFAMHERGVNQAIVDLNLARPIDFAVVDGIWGMEGDGPWEGDPVRMDMVIAGRNALAVDLVCLQAMDVPQSQVQHLAYAVEKGLGPADASSIDVLGDPFSPKTFRLPTIPPFIERPRAIPSVFAPDRGEGTAIVYWVDRPCWTRVEIIRTSDLTSDVTAVRLLRGWTLRLAGRDILIWDGRDDQGQLVPEGEYTIHIEATGGEVSRNHAHATGWVSVVAEEMSQRAYLPAVLR
jgi:uncharacterized protein (DUF362 family)